MKKIIVFLFIIVLVCLLSGNKREDLLTNNAIRFRIIANSNNLTDQNTKKEIKKTLMNTIEKIETESKDISSARKSINKYLPEINNIISSYNIPYNINYGMNTFPEKEYLGYKFPNDKYESLVITIGDGIGDNWWCILFPPLCLIEAKKDNISNVEYDFYIKKILNSL